MKTLLYSTACCAVLVSGARAQSPGAELRILDVPPGYPRSVGLALSDDAGVIVGLAWSCDIGCTIGVRWDAQGRVTVFPGKPPRPGIPQGVSPDGRLIVGYAMPPGSTIFQPVVWRDGVLDVLPMLPNSSHGMPRAVSADGRVIAGSATLPHTSPYSGMVRWVDAKVEDLSRTPGEAPANSGRAIDATGRHIAGAGLADYIRAVRVDAEARHVRDLGDLAGVARGDNGAEDIDATGFRIVGGAQPGDPRAAGEAYLWSAPTGMIGLGFPPHYPYCSGAGAIARHLPVVAGEDCTRTPYRYLGFLWDPVRAKRYLNDILDALGVDRLGWTINNINDINHDGTLMTGMARRGDDRRAYLVRLPPWCFADCDASGDLDFNDFLCFINRYNNAAADPRAHPIDFIYADFQLDDVIDFGDVLAFMDLYGRGCPK